MTETILPARWLEYGDPDLPWAVELVAAVRRAEFDTSTAADRSLLTSLGFGPLENQGGNNTLYRLRQNGTDWCLKLFRQDGRSRCEREWGGLCLFAERQFQFAPRPAYFERDPEPAALLMELVPGIPLGGADLTRPQLEAVAEVTRTIHSITPLFTEDSLWPIDWDVRPILVHMSEEVKRLGRQHGEGPIADACHLADNWLSGPDPELLLQQPSIVFSRGDPNLANCLWADGQLRIVDLEYCGWLDRAIDLAHVVEHIRSRGTPHKKWQWFVDQFDLSTTERRRFSAAQRRMALYWLLSACARPHAIHGLDTDDPVQLLLQRALLVCREKPPC